MSSKPHARKTANLLSDLELHLSRPHVMYGGGEDADLRLPRLCTFNDYDDKSYTRVKLAKVFPGRVKFVVWNDFDAKVEKTRKKVVSIPKPIFDREVGSWLDQCRKKIDPVTYRHIADATENNASIDSPANNYDAYDPEDLMEPPDYLQESESATTAFGSSENQTAVPNTENSSGALKCERSMTVAEANRNGIPVFVNYVSCIQVNGLVMFAVENLLRLIRQRPDYHLLSEIPLNSELAREYDLDRGPPEFLTLVPDYALMRSFVRPAYTLSTFTIELKGPLRTFWDLSHLPKSTLCGETRDHKCIVKDTAEVCSTNKDANKPTEEDKTGATHTVENKSSIADNAVRTGSHEENQCSSSCSSGRERRPKQAELRSEIRRKKRVNAVSGKKKKGKAVAGKSRSSGTADSRESSPLPNVLAEVAAVSRNEDPYNYSAKGLSEFYNELFKDDSILKDGDRKRAYYFMYLPVAQALSQALLSKSGCCALYNHQEAVAFKIRRVGRGEDFSLQVQVSRAFSCDEEPCNVLMLTTLANESSSDLVREPGRIAEMREIFHDASNAFVKKRLGRKGSGNPKTSGGSSNQAEKNSGNSGGTSSTQEGPKDEDLMDFSNLSHSKRFERLSEVSSRSSMDHYSESSGANVEMVDVKHYNVEEQQGCDSAIDQKFAEVIRGNHGVLASGSSGVVLSGTWGGQSVVIKSWNGVSREGLQCLLNEIRIYDALSKDDFIVLGRGVPFMRLNRTVPKEDAALVLDFVGKEIRRTRNGMLVLIDSNHEEVLSRGIVIDIGHEASKSLQMLHNSGVVHGDKRLSNLRVECRNEPSNAWHAWWIDLGNSRFDAIGGLEMEVERHRLIQLFPEAPFDLLVRAE